jgi:hypothetical protein
MGRGAHHRRGPHQLADLQPHEADAGARARDQQRFASREAAGGDDRIVHGLQRHRQAGGLREGHVVAWNAVHPAPVGHDILRVAARRRAHHAVARLDGGHRAADRLDLAGAFQAEPRPHTADAAMLKPGRDHEIGAIKARGAHPDQDLIGAGRRLGQVAQLDPGLAQNGSFHGGSSGSGTTYTPEEGIHCNGEAGVPCSRRAGFGAS